MDAAGKWDKQQKSDSNFRSNNQIWTCSTTFVMEHRIELTIIKDKGNETIEAMEEYAKL